MTKISKKAILSILSLVLTFVALGATTFAWFSLGTTATVSPFDLEVKGSEGLEIKFGDNTSWYSTINSDLIKNYIIELITEANDEEDLDEVLNDGKFVMNAVTTKNGKDFFTYGISGSAMIHGEDQAAVANKDFLQLEFRLRTTAKQAINVSSLVVTDNGPETSAGQEGYWTADQNFTLAKNNLPVTAGDQNAAPVVPATRLESHLADALRVAFVVKANDTDTEDTVVAFENDDEGATNTLGTLAGGPEGPYIGAFEYYAKKSGYGSADDQGITLSPAIDWSPLKAETPGEGEDPATPNLFGNNLANRLFNAPEDDLGEGESYYYHDITVNIWFEGYDNEAFDYVLNQLVSISMAFSLVD